MIRGRPLIKYFTTASSGAGATDVVVRPAEGVAWKVNLLVGYQADGDIACNWVWTDAAYTKLTIVPDVTLALNACLPFGSYDDNALSFCRMPIWITRTSYPTFIFTASAGGKNGYVKALVEEFLGMWED